MSSPNRVSLSNQWIWAFLPGKVSMTTIAQPFQLALGFLTPQEFARATGLSLKTVHRYLKSGKIPKFQPGGHRCRVAIPTSALAPTSAITQPVPASERVQEADTKAAENNPAPSRSGPRPRWLSR